MAKRGGNDKAKGSPKKSKEAVASAAVSSGSGAAKIAPSPEVVNTAEKSRLTRKLNERLDPAQCFHIVQGTILSRRFRNGGRDPKTGKLQAFTIKELQRKMHGTRVQRMLNLGLIEKTDEKPLTRREKLELQVEHGKKKRIAARRAESDEQQRRSKSKADAQAKFEKDQEAAAKA